MPFDIDHHVAVFKRGAHELLIEAELRTKLGRGKPLQIKEGFSLLSAAGSNMHVDMDGLQQEIRRFLQECIEVRSVSRATRPGVPAP